MEAGNIIGVIYKSLWLVCISESNVFRTFEVGDHSDVGIYSFPRRVWLDIYCVPVLLLPSEMSSSDEKFPDFFKVFLPHLCSQEMKIPDAFIERINEKIPKQVILRSRVGETWVVEVAEKEEGVFIKSGWSRLVLDKSLKAGDFLVFKYNGHHVFDIIIFGPTGCEKEQVCSSARQQKSMTVVSVD